MDGYRRFRGISCLHPLGDHGAESSQISGHFYKQTARRHNPHYTIFIHTFERTKNLTHPHASVSFLRFSSYLSIQFFRLILLQDTNNTMLKTLKVELRLTQRRFAEFSRIIENTVLSNNFSRSATLSAAGEVHRGVIFPEKRIL